MSAAKMCIIARAVCSVPALCYERAGWFGASNASPALTKQRKVRVDGS